MLKKLRSQTEEISLLAQASETLAAHILRKSSNREQLLDVYQNVLDRNMSKKQASGLKGIEAVMTLSLKRILSKYTAPSAAELDLETGQLPIEF